jgi:DNA adenine methylase
MAAAVPTTAKDGVALRAPFPWFGGKSRAALLIWERLGDPPNYVEPFFGSGAVMFGRPARAGIETVNDLDCYVANFWRAVTRDPEAVAHYADWPVNEADLHARHTWLVGRRAFRERMKTKPDYFDAKVAGWWVWGICQWIGGEWCIGFRRRGRTNAGRAARGIHAGGIWRKRPKLGGHGLGSGVHRSRPNLGQFGNGVHRKLPKCDRSTWSRLQIPDISGDSGAAGRGVHASGRRGGLGCLVRGPG